MQKDPVGSNSQNRLKNDLNFEWAPLTTQNSVGSSIDRILLPEFYLAWGICTQTLSSHWLATKLCRQKPKSKNKKITKQRHQWSHYEKDFTDLAQACSKQRKNNERKKERKKETKKETKKERKKERWWQSSWGKIRAQSCYNIASKMSSSPTKLQDIKRKKKVWSRIRNKSSK